MNPSSSLQRKQLLTKDYPPFWSWSKVKKFPQVVSHAKKSTFEGTHEFQTHIGNDTTTPNSKSAYKWLTENLLSYKFIHTNLYSSSLSTTFPCNLKNKSSTSSTTQSFKEHEKQGFQWPLFPCWTQRSATQASFATDKAYKEGKETHNGSSPPHLSIQNFTLLSPATKEKKTQENVLFLPNGFPKPDSIPNSNFTKTPPTIFLSIFATNQLCPKGTSFSGIPPTPFAQKRLI